MTIHRLLENSGFGPDEVASMAAAYDDICRRLHLTLSSYSAAHEVVASKVIATAQTGLRDPAEIAKRVLAEIQNPSTEIASPRPAVGRPAGD